MRLNEADRDVRAHGILRLESPRATARIPEGIGSAASASDKGRSIVAELVQAYARHGSAVFS